MARASVVNHLDDRALLEVVGDVIGLLDIRELRVGMLRALRRALPSDYASLNDVGPRPEQIVAIIEPEAPVELHERWAVLAHENPLLRYYQRTQDGRPNRFSDVIEREALHELALYRELYAPMGVEHQLAFTLPANGERVLAIALSRGEHDYSDAECDFVDRLRPFLIQAYLNALALEAQAGQTGAPDLRALVAAGMTSRESEVLQLLALGRSNEHIAAALGISYRTVAKHLENSFRKLGVCDRSSASGRVWELCGGSLSLLR
jgi:DNA-binding CsgD family transcriptional regulator